MRSFSPYYATSFCSSLEFPVITANTSFSIPQFLEVVPIILCKKKTFSSSICLAAAQLLELLAEASTKVFCTLKIVIVGLKFLKELQIALATRLLTFPREIRMSLSSSVPINLETSKITDY